MSKSAPQSPKSRLRLNLLYPQGVPQKLHLKFIKWLISYGRFIVVGVEVLVLATFAMRFKYDDELGTLKESINEEASVVQNMSEIETNIRQMQIKLTTIDKAYKAVPDTTTFFIKFNQHLPKSVYLTNLSLNATPITGKIQFKASATAGSNNDLSLFFNKIKRDDYFKNLSLSNVNYNLGEVTFNVNGEVR